MKPYKLKYGDKVAVVSLSNGILGEDFAKHELEIGLRRLKEFGLIPVLTPNALKGIEYLKKHPEKRAEDLKIAFMDDEIKMIITAIGGDDTYKTIPYLMDDQEFINAVKKNPKIFTGFSDTTYNHFMLNKLGLSTFYGPSFLVDFAELDDHMLSYTKKYFSLFFDDPDNFEIESSSVWYKDRASYDLNEIGVSRIKHDEIHGFELLNGGGVKTGELFGGCIESIYDMLVGECYGDENQIIDKYDLFPKLDELKNKILFLETSEEKVHYDKLEIMLEELKKRKILENVRGILIGKPYDEIYYNEYKKIYIKVLNNIDTPVLYNINFGHAYPRCIIPYDAQVTVDFDNKKIFITSKIFNELVKEKDESNNLQEEPIASHRR